MFRVDLKATGAPLLLAALAMLPPYAIDLAAVAAPESSSSTSVTRRSVSTFVIGEQTIGQKTFTTSKMIVNAAPARVWEILTDYDGAANTFSNLTKSKLLSSSGPTKLVAFSARTAGNLFKFDYTLEITEKHLELIKWRRASGAFKADEGYWRLDPLESGNATLVSYAKHIDGGFFYPQALLKRLIRDTIPVIFAELKSSAESARLATSRPHVIIERGKDQ